MATQAVDPAYSVDVLSVLPGGNNNNNENRHHLQQRHDRHSQNSTALAASRPRVELSQHCKGEADNNASAMETRLRLRDGARCQMNSTLSGAEKIMKPGTALTLLPIHLERIHFRPWC